MTLAEVISALKKIRPNNAFDDEQVRSWIESVEGRICREVLNEDRAVVLEADSELTAPAPYSDMYLIYALAMLEFFLGEYSKYNNTITAFIDLFDRYRAWHIRNNRPGESRVKIW